MRFPPRVLTLLAVAVLAATEALPAQSSTPAAANNATLIQQATRAGLPGITGAANIVDWSGAVIRRGTNGWTCYPDMPETTNTSMCLDGPWTEWLDAYANQRPFRATRLAISYMLMGDAGASNTDPYATGPTPTNQWVVSGPHLMILVPDAATLDGIPTDPHSGGPFVMWKGTPYAHVMVPVPAPPR